MSFFDPNTGSDAEDQMAQAFGCVAVTVIGIVGLVVVGIILLVRALL
jgi:hypothetical protein